MILDATGIPLSKKAIQEQMPQHQWGNSLLEIGTFLQKQNIRTTLFTDGHKLPGADAYLQQGGSLDTAQIGHLSDGTFIAGITRSNGQKKEAHYVVILKDGSSCHVFDPAEESPYRSTLPELLASSRDRVQKNGFWLRIRAGRLALE